MGLEGERKPNRLIKEKSPYLLQHAYNPVDWYPWCEEAFEKARREDKPIFLSIGYSTCHWCHVMEKESFEDPEVARLLNETFVCIKVDREERPDLDAVYMEVCQLMTGSGGWPLTIIMTPDKKPFFAATYIPKKSRFGMMGLLELIPKIRDAWANRRAELLEASESILGALKGGVGGPAKVDGKKLLEQAYVRLYEEFDETHGGFGIQPKFPMAHRLSFLLRHYKRRGDRGALYMVEKTLQRIRYGGIFDQVGWGVHRYSTDQRWMVPHFEKMLYDQAALSIAYLEAHQATGKSFYAECAREIFEFTLRELYSPDGGFYTALDADSEGVEGKYYLWGWDELEAALTQEELTALREYYNVSKEGNLGEGVNILHAEVGLEDFAAEKGLDPDRLKAVLEGARRKLFELRARRVRPGRDEKVLADNNGYMIAALAKGAPILGTKFLGAAEDAARFVLSKMASPDGGLYHVHAGGEAYIQGLLNDYAYMVWGLIELYQATFKTEYLRHALRLNEYMLKHFWDDANGGFYLTSDTSEQLPVRPKEVYDGAIPSGNSVGFANLVRLSRMTGRVELEEKAGRLLEAVGAQLERSPEGFTHLLCGLDLALGPSYEVVVVGERGSQEATKLFEALRTRFLPNCVFVFKDLGDQEISELCAYTKQMVGGRRPLIYVCSNYSCNMPTESVEEALRQMGEKVG